MVSRPRLAWSRLRASPFPLLVAVLVCGVVSLSMKAPGKLLRVWPDELVSSNSVQAAIQSPSLVQPVYAQGAPGVAFTNVNFHALLDLRPGRRFTSVRYYHSGSGPGAYTVVSLLRVTMGGQTEVLASGGSTEVTTGELGTAVIPVELVITSEDLVVHKGERYVVTVNVDDSHAAVHGVEVSYH